MSDDRTFGCSEVRVERHGRAWYVYTQDGSTWSFACKRAADRFAARQANIEKAVVKLGPNRKLRRH